MDSIAEERHIHMAKYAWQYFCEAGLHCFSKLFALGRNRDRATVSLRRNAPLEPPPSNDGSICRSSWGSAFERCARDKWNNSADTAPHARGGAELIARAAGLASVRDQVLHKAQITAGEIVLDVGAGDGLIAFGALEVPGEQGTVIFSDISPDLLDNCQSLAQQLGARDCCQFLRAAADDLRALDAATVDVATNRSVLIFTTVKQQAFNEFYRVLKPGGRLSIYEPINRFGCLEPPQTFWGHDVIPISDLAHKVRAAYERHQLPQTNRMLDFDERDLLTFAERVGFGEIHLKLKVEIGPASNFTPSRRWEVAMRTASNPLAPTLEEAMRAAAGMSLPV